ncbi:PfkB family carbohydrate kinase [Promicromonospora thailandica]|uniref:Sugar or nucleoside kinase, ribokinase family n=1 Tax=Promicromonospora thailandica TaxID=765201 RepID=A0A9X2G0L3_9MICO|nr:PfkB family carbohydrate kinase [Promicromonospora thailandica]MCP2263173.1 Sugar or nucleoside kinase, ribokinase family [Promicromonospora thailandica]BFF18559.1 PfkB family carbohydrate kinase [Promicromonospora thailandica]
MSDAPPETTQKPALTCWFAGLTTLDVIHRSVVRPGPNQKVTAVRQDVSAGGPAANAAVTAASLGARALLISPVGAGPVGAAARGDLEHHGVEVHDTAAGTEIPLAVSAVMVDDETGDRSVVSPDATLVDGVDVTPVDLDALPRPRVVLLDGHHPDLARRVLAYAKTLDPRPMIVLDAGRWRPVFADLMGSADVTARSADFHAPDGVARSRATVATHGGDPVTWCDEAGRKGTTNVPAVDVRDTLGAGDAFHGALVVALGRGLDLEAAVEEAVRVATIRVQHVGPRSWLEHLPCG